MLIKRTIVQPNFYYNINTLWVFTSKFFDKNTIMHSKSSDSKMQTSHAERSSLGTLGRNKILLANKRANEPKGPMSFESFGHDCRLNFSVRLPTITITLARPADTHAVVLLTRSGRVMQCGCILPVVRGMCRRNVGRRVGKFIWSFCMVLNC